MCSGVCCREIRVTLWVDMHLVKLIMIFCKTVILCAIVMVIVA